MEPIEILGIASAALALIAFIGNEYGQLKANSLSYDLLNFVSGAGLFLYAYYAGVIPFMITNAVWALVSGADIVRYFLKAPRLKKRR